MKTVYVVVMNRWGEVRNPTHSYIEGVYEDLELAQANGANERLRRDCKYEPEIKTFTLNQSAEKRIDIALAKYNEKKTAQKKHGVHSHFPKEKKKRKIVI